MIEPLFQGRTVKALILDVDGTLYRLATARRAILLRMLRAYSRHPLEGLRTLGTIRAYRRAQEHLRGQTLDDIAAAQISAACKGTHLDRLAVAQCVHRWMECEPLTILPACIQPGLVDFLHMSKTRGLRLCALSDYPPESKLRALNVLEFFDVVLSAQSPTIGAFKPHPRGIQTALSMLNVRPADSLYIGDRIDVDVAAAKAAGVACVILTRRPVGIDSAYTAVSDYGQLQRLLLS